MTTQVINGTAYREQHVPSAQCNGCCLDTSTVNPKTHTRERWHDDCVSARCTPAVRADQHHVIFIMD